MSLHQRIASAFERIAALARSHEGRAARTQALSPLQSRVLGALRRRGGLRIGELADELLVTYGTVSAAVTTLEEKGLVAKRDDPAEHRAVRVGLTRRGARAAERGEGWATRLFEPALEDLDPGEAEVLLAALLKVIRSFERRGWISRSRMCLTCRHFEPRRRQGPRPHHCHLLREPLGEGDLRIDCPEHQEA